MNVNATRTLASGYFTSRDGKSAAPPRGNGRADGQVVPMPFPIGLPSTELRH